MFKSLFNLVSETSNECMKGWSDYFVEEPEKLEIEESVDECKSTNKYDEILEEVLRNPGESYKITTQSYKDSYEEMKKQNDKLIAENRSLRDQRIISEKDSKTTFGELINS